jgi:hypothetical protein
MNKLWSRTSRAMRLTAVLGGIGAGALALAATPALAEQRYVLSGSFGELCTSEPCGPGQLKEPTGVAVNDSAEALSDPAAGDVYVADTGNARIERFSSDGVLLSGFDGTETPAKSFSSPEAIAVDNSGLSILQDPSAEDVYVVDTGHNAVDKFSPAGAYLSQLVETPSAPLSDIRGVAVDTSGNVWVYEAGAFIGNLVEFDSSGNFLKSFETEHGTEPGVAVDSNGAVYAVLNPQAGVTNPVLKLEGASGSVLQQFGEDVTALAVDPANDDLLLDRGNGIALFGPFGEPSSAPNETFPAEGISESHGLAVNRDSTAIASQRDKGDVEFFNPVVFPTVATGAASNVTETGATLHGTVNPEGVPITDCKFEYGPTTSYGNSVPCVQTPGEIGTGNAPVTVTAELSGLPPASIRHFRLDAANANGTTRGSDLTISRPLIDSESVSEVTSTSAILATMINPLGLPTRYRFEYGPTTSYTSSVPIPDGSVGSGDGDVSPSVLVQGLASGTAYHYRVVASNSLGAVEGADHTFATQGGEGARLLDGRAWEMVSPADKQGAALESITEEGGVIQASEDGRAITYVAAAPIVAEPQGNRSIAYTQVRSTRRTDGWATEDITTPHEAVVGLHPGQSAEYKMFSADLSVSALEPEGETPLSAQTTEQTPYRRETDGDYKPLVTAGNVPPGTKFGHSVSFVSATPDLSHIVLRSSQALTEGVVSGSEPSLFEWADGALTLVSILPDGTATSAEGEPAELGAGGIDVRNAVSDNGSRIVFHAGDHLYVRDTNAGETVQLDAVEPGAEGGAGVPVFQTATSDGSKIFFTDESRLTTDATSGGATHPDLYMCEIDNIAGGCALKDVTVDQHAGEAADVQGVVLGVGGAGRYVYFVANGVLAAGAQAGQCRFEGAPSDAACSLYVYDTTAAETTFIATLSNTDAADWNESAGPTSSPNLGRLSSRVSPNGRYLAFMSERSLTGYDNVDAHGGQRDEEVFLYDVSVGRLVCVSCNPTGARPSGVFDRGEFPGLLVDRPQVWGGHWLAGSLPGWTRNETGRALYQSRYLSDSGRLFFDSADALVPQDANGKEDVYEYEPAAVGSCEREDGCVGLISSGVSSEESAFLDGSKDGEDVFFLTSAKLAPSQDIDGEFDLYDAHICSSGSPCPATTGSVPPACATADSCRAAPSSQPQIFGPPASATLSGVGNVAQLASGKPKPLTRAQKLMRALSACRTKRNRRRRAICDARAHKRYGPARAKPRPLRTMSRKGGN